MRAVLLVLSALLLAGPAAAQVVTPRPSTIAISLAHIPPTVTVDWQLGPTGAPWTSYAGEIQTAGPAPVVLSTLPSIGPQPPNFTYREVVPLPVDQIRALAASGVREFAIIRGWDEGGDSTLVGVAIIITSGLGANFRVSRVGLRFPDGAPLRIVSQFSAQEIYADVSYSGGGELQAVWEVADPTTTAGAPVFRPLQRVRRMLTGGQRTSVRSPPLPTTLTGLHLVRFRLDGTEASFEDPVIRYYVAEEDVPVDPVLVPLVAPVHEATLERETVFRWVAVPGARAYRLELYDVRSLPPGPNFRLDPEHPTFGDARTRATRKSVYEGATLPGDDPPIPLAPYEEGAVAGVLVGGDQTEARLGAARRHLEAGGTYLWIVRALGEGGVPLGLSPTRVLRVPEQDPSRP